MKNCHIKDSFDLMKSKDSKITGDLKFALADKQLFFQFFCGKLSNKARK